MTKPLFFRPIHGGPYGSEVRVLVVALLLLATGGLCVQYATTDHWPYPSTAEISSSPGAHDGERVFFFVTVQSVDRDDREMVVTTASDPTLRFTVTGVPVETLDRVGADGNAVQVSGTLREGASAIAVDEVVVDYRDTADRQYVYVTSLLGGLLAAGYALWHWTVDLRRLRLTPRRDC